MLLMLLFLFLLFGPSTLGDLRVLVKGSRVLFDGSARQILINRRRVAAFHDVACVRVTRINNARQSGYYELCVDLKGPRRLELDARGSQAEYVIAANAIAGILHARIEQNER